ncbi:RHS repeat-associated core domain-containing protein [Pseudomonas sp. P5_109]|uniref:RHS repeat-associated core domain-containing protein n=1 Tax=Pseudomonas sp. P5_109 TaxID=3043441 RepID=UPI002A36FA0A|nr:RHS repeat-associated core domain-containing protein [Pseudomonas sp. P5_109]WPN28120.1 RHS repeat-associated core domain-containing protein [Pseudomonas sp. P5_109]
MNAHHHAATPTLSVIDPRALAIRGVGYYRHPDSPEIDPRITRQRFDAAGRLVESWDPRLWGTAPKPNLTTVYGLSGQPLLTDSVDAGWQLSLADQAGLPGAFWDARGSQRHTGFDEQQRPITVTEQAVGERPRVLERLTYGDSGPAFAGHNQCGQLIRHDHPAGTQCTIDYGLLGAVLVEEQRFLADLETPDWPLDLDERETWLEAQSFITLHTFNPGAELQRQTDAMGNVRTFGYDVAGKLSEAWLQLTASGKPPQRLVSDIHYNAQDQVERETAGNGVVTRAAYAADDGRLIRLMAAVGNQKPLQDLNYVYDAGGNIVELQDQSQSVTHFNNQRIEPINRYRYDSLYQLVEAKGWEVSQPSHGPTLPELQPTPLDPNQRRNYTQRFEYDRGGNLITRRHSDAPGFLMFTSARSNRSLAQRDDGSLPGEPEIALGFDAAGNQQELQRGQAMAWDSRNQLHQVTLVNRESEPDDYECYRYSHPGHRLRKVGFAQSSGRILRSEIRYLPGLEVHRQAGGEEHHVISFEAGRSKVRVLFWPQGEHDDQWRYNLSDHLGSNILELDHEAGVLTQEYYYPFGGTACWAGSSVLVAKYKTIRYSGKERDATGLYYYGFRYYAPWMQRWISPDPVEDGLNVFQMVANNPLNLIDRNGLTGETAKRKWRAAYDRVLATNVGVRVRTVTSGVIAVDVVGGNDLFERLGIGLERAVDDVRKLSYLSIDSSLQGKIAGGDRLFYLYRESGAAIKEEARLESAGTLAYINGGFFNMGGGFIKNAPDYASIGRNLIDGEQKESVLEPLRYSDDYTKVSMHDGSWIRSGPLLAVGETATFSQGRLKNPLYQFSSGSNKPGWFGHASEPNSRSGISMGGDENPESRTRLAMGGTWGRDATSPGYTMPEWALVMTRLNSLNRASFSTQAVNLDGGNSSALGVISSSGESLMTRSQTDGLDKSVGNFIVFYRKSTGSI